MAVDQIAVRGEFKSPPALSLSLLFNVGDHDTDHALFKRGHDD